MLFYTSYLPIYCYYNGGYIAFTFVALKNNKIMKKVLIVLSLLSFAMSNLFAQTNNFEEQEINTSKEKEFKKFRVGGYGEILFESMDYGPNRYSGAGVGSAKLDNNRNTIDLPRFVLATDYKLSKSWRLSSEIEFEHGGTGAGIEPEYGEGIEYEYEFEKAGEVVLEQFFLEKTFSKAFKVRVGHQILPVGLTNYQHEPIFYMGTSRPAGESTIIPCTWHDTGLSILGSYKWLDYQFMVVNGLDPLGFSERNWIQNGRQTKYEEVRFEHPAFAARLDFHALDGLRIGLSGYYAAKTVENSINYTQLAGADIPVAIGSVDATYRGYGAVVRANVLYGYIGDTDILNAARRNALSGYENSYVTPNALTYFIEAGYNIGGLIKDNLNIMPFVRYEYLNPSENEFINSYQPSDPRNCGNIFAVGVNYFPIPSIVVKADYAHCKVGTNGFLYNNENTFSISVGFLGWFFQK